jgi:hypothetical protein
VGDVDHSPRSAAWCCSNLAYESRGDDSRTLGSAPRVDTKARALVERHAVIAASREFFAPRRLSELLARLVAEGPPAVPLEVGE